MIKLTVLGKKREQKVERKKVSKCGKLSMYRIAEIIYGGVNVWQIASGW